MPEFEQGVVQNPFDNAFRELFPDLLSFAACMVRSQRDAALIVVDGFLDLEDLAVDFADIPRVRVVLYKTIGYKCLQYILIRVEEDRETKYLFNELIGEVAAEIERQAQLLAGKKWMREVVLFILEELDNLPPPIRNSLRGFFLKGKTARQIFEDNLFNKIIGTP